MEQEDLLNKHKLRSLLFAKRISSTLIILSVAVILISIFTYILVFYFPVSKPRLMSMKKLAKEREFYYYMRDLFLPSWIIPSALCIAILTPIRIFVGKRLKIHIIVHFKKDFRHHLKLYKLKKTRDYQDKY